MAEREQVLGFLRELERADEEVGGVLAELDELASEVESVRRRAVELEAFFVRAPAEREAAGTATARARDELVAARAALSEAEQAVQEASEERLRLAEHFAVRARDCVTIAERRADEAAVAEEAVIDAERAASEESEAVDARARTLARALGHRPGLGDAAAVPEAGLAGVAEWGSTARAALFVARGQLAAQRDAVIRQANELGALALGEPLMSVSAGVVVRRVERELSD